MSFLSPIWLFSVAAISIPLLIHLWNIRPGKTLKVGSIALIENSSRKRSRSLKLLDILLLLLRCLLLITVAFVLATPYLKKPANIESKGWLLIPKEDFREAYQRYKPKADSLLKAGYELHYFDEDFSGTTIQQALADTSAFNNERHVSYWNLLQQLDRQVAGSRSVDMITPNLLNNFSGEKPGTALKVRWQTYTPADSIAVNIQSAWFSPDEDVHVVVGTSMPSGTFYKTEKINRSATQNSPYVINVTNGKATVNLKKENQSPVVIDTAALKIDVFAGSNIQDATYINAALQTIGQFTQRNIIIKPYANDPKRVSKDWLFWLSDKPIAKNVLKGYANVLMYQQGKAAPVNSWINWDGVSREPVALYRCVKFNKYNGEAVWNDGFGNPLLTAEFKSKTVLYHFNSRFNPSWSELVWNADFPKIMFGLIMPVKVSAGIAVNDRRKIETGQMLPNFGGGVQGRIIYSKTYFTHYLWLLISLLFVLERWLAHRKAEGALL